MNRSSLRLARRGKARTVPLRRLVPNILTTISLCSGLASLHFALAGDWDRALSAIAVAAVFDVLDGGAARLLRASSRFGAVLDSLSDFVSFGVAPAVILHQWMLADARAPGVFATMTFALCAALRLARFTSARSLPSGSPMARFFVGLPTPAAACIVLIPVMLDVARTTQIKLPAWLVITHVFFIAWLMISRQPFFSMKKLRIHKRFVAPLMVAVGLLVLAAAKDPWLTATGLASAYLLTISMSITLARRYRRDMALAQPQPQNTTQHQPSQPPASPNAPHAPADRVAPDPTDPAATLGA